MAGLLRNSCCEDCLVLFAVLSTVPGVVTMKVCAVSLSPSVPPLSIHGLLGVQVNVTNQRPACLPES